MNISSDSSEMFKTPSPSRRKSRQRNLFSDRCTRAQKPRTPGMFRSDMESMPSTPKFSPSQPKMKDRSRTDPVPNKFRCEMPMSARKAEPSPIPPSEREFLPIVQSSFYGTKNRSLNESLSSNEPSPRTLPKNTASKIEFDSNRPVLHPLSSQNLPSSKKCSSFNTKGNKGSKSSGTKKHQLLKRNYASGSVMKSRKKVKMFGSKGVSHAIKKPKKLIVPPKPKLSKNASIKEKTFAQLFRESLEEEKKAKRQKSKKKKSQKFNKDDELTDDDDENKPEPRNMTPKRTGNIALNTSRNVSYEIKNGQPVFRLRRSPRKSLQNAYLKATHDKVIAKPLKASNDSLSDQPNFKGSNSSPTPTKRRSSSKLFTPSGDRDYLGLSPRSKERRLSKPNLPSPVKFMADETGGTDDKENSAVLNIIDHLENTLEAENSVADKPSQDDYAMYVTDDEAERLALETVQQLAEIEPSFDDITDNFEELPGFKPTKEGNLSFLEDGNTVELKLVDNDPIEKIENETELCNLSNTMRNQENLKLNKSQGIDEKGDSCKKPVTFMDAKMVKENNSKLFSIFDKSSVPKRTETSQESLKSTKRLKAITTQAGRDGLTQMIIDAGQKKIGAQHCLKCDFVYSDDPSEQRAHDIRHAKAMGYIDFKGWKKEEKIDCPDLDGRIVVVKYRDANNHWEKVETVLEVVDNTLGIIPIGEDEKSRIRNPSQSMAFLFVSSSKQVTGFLLAEHISAKSDNITKTLVIPKKSKEPLDKNFEPVMYELDEKTQNKVCAGISRIWVRSDYQRKGIGSRMVDAMRTHFLGHYHFLSPEQFAFSHTTPNGTDFAMKYMTKKFSKKAFLTYAPALVAKETTKKAI